MALLGRAETREAALLVVLAAEAQGRAAEQAAALAELVKRGDAARRGMRPREKRPQQAQRPVRRD